ncbi:MAG: YbhB/YbcL family Raf kinase inhibitor-like protein [Candidatus Melainabacteria bacterium HGW-Melainabacteria-1]|nr:MAG: YbhB/YbcL family Raf kinase inhibitor-like protein [Candidatus Melainabacteria bacterium HGW-Melainabacteria-1]
MSSSLPLLRSLSPLLIGLVLSLVIGCESSETGPEGENQAKASTAPESESHATSFKLASTAFGPEQPIPPRHACTGQDLTPALAWIHIPADTRSLALLLEDPDARIKGKPFTHWLIYNIPPEISILPEGLPASETLSLGALQGLNDFGRPGYGGPCPPPGQPHRYVFRLYALDAMLSLQPGVNRAAFEQAIQGHLLAEARLTGSFAR